MTGQFNFGYDVLSRRTSLTKPNGVNTSYNYDSLSRLLSVLHKSGTATVDGASYTYDNAGNRTAKTNQLSGITEQYTYDPLYQLTQVVQGTPPTAGPAYDDPYYATWWPALAKSPDFSPNKEPGRCQKQQDCNPCDPPVGTITYQQSSANPNTAS